MQTADTPSTPDRQRRVAMRVTSISTLAVGVGIAVFGIGMVLHDIMDASSGIAFAASLSGTIIVLVGFVLGAITLAASPTARRVTGVWLSILAAAAFLLLVLPRLGK